MGEVVIRWSGASGRDYKYWVLDGNVSLKNGPGNYIFAKETSPGNWTAIYVGEADNLKDILSNPDKFPAIKDEGNVSIHAHMGLPEKTLRKEEELDLIQSLNPPYNQR
jgi:hypothetical protein